MEPPVGGLAPDLRTAILCLLRKDPQVLPVCFFFGLSRDVPNSQTRLSTFADVRALAFFEPLNFERLEVNFAGVFSFAGHLTGHWLQAKELPPPYAVDDQSKRSTRVSEVVKACEAAFVDSNTSADASNGRREINGFSYSEETSPAAYDV